MPADENCPTCGTHWAIREVVPAGTHMTRRMTCNQGHLWSREYHGKMESQRWWVYTLKPPVRRIGA